MPDGHLRVSERSTHETQRWLALAVLLTGTLLPPLDFFIVNVALPAIRSDLRAPTDVAQLDRKSGV